METKRDLGQIELWQESLERSLARRGKLSRASLELYRLQPERDLSVPDLLLESTAYWQARRLAAASRPAIPRPVVGLGGLSALALVSATALPSLFGKTSHSAGEEVAYAGHIYGPTPLGNGQARSHAVPAAVPARPRPQPPAPVTQVVHPTTETVAQTPTEPAPTSTHVQTHHTEPAAHATTAHVVHRTATPVARHTAPPKPAVPKPTTTHKAPAPKPPAPKSHKPPAPKHHKPPPPPPPATGYVNPLADASVTPERIDEGVDYAGTGTLTSIGRGRVNYVGTSGTGWPGAFIEYQLLNGRYAGRYVYYAEGVRPASGIYVGRILQPGDAVASLIPGWSTGIEIGWGAGIGTETLAAELGQRTFPTPAGENFSAFIASLGGPPGR